MSATPVLPAVADGRSAPPAPARTARAAPAAGWVTAALSGVLAAAAIPRGPATGTEVVLLVAGVALAGVLCGALIHSRWSVVAVPVLHVLGWEVARATVFRLEGPTFGAPRFDVQLGVLLFVAVHVLYALVAGLPILLGVLAGRAAVQGRRRAVVVRATVLVLVAGTMGAGLVRAPGVAPVLDTSGGTVPGSVATLEKVQLGGVGQWVSVRGRDAGNPVLLHLSGGPGTSDVGWLRTFNQPLEEHFTVAVWEQRGVGKSYPALDPTGTLTLDRLVSDGVELAGLLAHRFGESKIYLTGNSWGSTLGVLMVQRRPDLFHAYVGTGQMVSQRETDRVLYRQLTEHAVRTGDDELRDRLHGYGEPPYRDVFGYAMVMEYYDVIEPYRQVPAFDAARGPGGFFPDEYSLLDTWNEVRGFADMGGLIYPQLQTVDFRTDVPALDVPVYFAHGRHELSARRALADEWIAGLQAPAKRVYEFAESGHNADAEEPARYHDLMVGTVLAETYVE